MAISDDKELGQGLHAKLDPRDTAQQDPWYMQLVGVSPERESTLPEIHPDVMAELQREQRDRYEQVERSRQSEALGGSAQFSPSSRVQKPSSSSASGKLPGN